MSSSMVSANSPRFDIQIGKTRFSRTPLDTRSGGTPGTLLDLVESVIINKNLDKTATKGKRKVKVNSCNVTIANIDKQLDNILRLGRKVTVWLGYAKDDLTRVGVYTLTNPKWVYPRTGIPKVQFKATAGENGLRGDNSGKVWRDKTVTQVVEEIAKKAGYEVDILHTNKKQVILKTVDEEYDDLIARLAYDLGYEYYFDDDDKLVFKPVNDREYLVVGGKQFTTGWGPGTPAAYPAASLEVEHNYPQPTVTATVRTTDGKVVTSGADNAVLIRIFNRGDISKEQFDHVRQTIGTGTTDTAGMAHKAQAAQSAQQLTKTLTCTYDPGIPYFRLGQLIKLVGHGDLSRTYRINDITHTVNKSGYTTQIKAAVGGNPTGNKATLPGMSVVTSGSTNAVKINVFQSPNSAKKEPN